MGGSITSEVFNYIHVFLFELKKLVFFFFWVEELMESFKNLFLLFFIFLNHYVCITEKNHQKEKW